MDNTKLISALVAIINLCLGLSEFIWSKVTGIKIYDTRDSLINLCILLGNTVLNSLAGGGIVYLYQEIYRYSFFTIPSNFVTFIILFIGIDFTIYWFHRLSHNSKWLFFTHALHHSSNNLNLTHAGRVSWINTMITILTFTPFTLIGFQPLFVLGTVVFHQIGLVWNHTQMIKKIGFLERILVTPSHHRVHHGFNDIYINKNYGGVFIIWDKLFKTFQPETEPVKFGVSKKFAQYNPYLIQYALIIDLIQTAFRKRQEK